MNRNLFILGFPRCGTSNLFHEIINRTQFSSLFDKIKNKTDDLHFDPKEPGALFSNSENQIIISEYMHGGIIDASQIYLTDINKISSYIKPHDIIIFLIRDRTDAIISLLNLKHSNQEMFSKGYANSELDNNFNKIIQDFGMPLWLFRDLILNSESLISNIKKDYDRQKLISPISRNANQTILQELQYFKKFNEWPWHCYLGTYFYGYRISELMKKIKNENLCIIKFEDFIKNPKKIVSKLGLKFNFEVNISDKLELDENRIWQSEIKQFKLTQTSKNIINKVYLEDDAILDFYTDNFLKIEQ